MQRILIISDNPKGTADLQQELICAGYPVLTCGGERTGVLQAVSPRPPEVLVLDTLASRLTMKELRALLRLPPTHRGRVLTREALRSQVWRYDYHGGNRTVDGHIRRIRAKLGTTYEELVGSVRNVGYGFNDPSRRPDVADCLRTRKRE